MSPKKKKQQLKGQKGITDFFAVKKKKARRSAGANRSSTEDPPSIPAAKSAKCSPSTSGSSTAAAAPTTQQQDASAAPTPKPSPVHHAREQASHHHPLLEEPTSVAAFGKNPPPAARRRLEMSADDGACMPQAKKKSRLSYSSHLMQKVSPVEAATPSKTTAAAGKKQSSQRQTTKPQNLDAFFCREATPKHPKLGLKSKNETTEAMADHRHSKKQVWKFRWDDEQCREKLLKKFAGNQYLLEHYLGQLKREQARVAGKKNQDGATNPPPKDEEKGPASSAAAGHHNLSDQQRQVAEHPPDIPLSVRAGAGSGKTQTMVHRAIQLTTRHGLDPSTLLLLTFTNRAAGEMRDRIQTEFEKIQQGEQQPLRLPTVKTFHSLAYYWIRGFWQRCGLGQYPHLLVTPAQQKNFMKQVIEARLKELQLKRCRRYLGLKDATTWEIVINNMQNRFPEEYQKALQNAHDKFDNKGKKWAKANKKKAPQRQGAAETRQEAERRLLLKSELERQCYLELLRRKREDPELMSCDLESKWNADTEQCKLYIKLVEKARLGQHKPQEYLPEDAQILVLYEKMQETTGNIDFDKLLHLFVRLLENNDDIRNGFHSLYNYVIVDEYQDNSEVQSKLLLKMVTQGRVTVVGDDDQCIYQFRGASPGNFEAFQQHYLSEHRSLGHPHPQAKLLENNYRSTANILKVGDAFLHGMAFQRGEKKLRPTREEGEKVVLWPCADTGEQAKRIATSVKKRHDQGGVSWGDMACLFRCFRMGKLGKLHSPLQQEFASQGIPFKVIGGDSFLNSEVLRDLLAYVSLTLTGSQERMDDDSFTRILNKPPRGLPNQALDLIKAQQSAMKGDLRKAQQSAMKEDASNQIRSVGLEEAAKKLLNNDKVLSKARRNGLAILFSLIKELRIAAIGKPLPALVLYVWDRTGLADWYGKRAASKAKRDNEAEVEEFADEAESPFSMPHPDNAKEQAKYIPSKVHSLIAVAAAHAEQWDERKTESSNDTNGVQSLFDLAKKCVMDQAQENLWLPQVYLPQHLLDDLHMPGGRGLPVVNSFLADLALQMTDDDQDEKEDDKVTISTVHRAKGLEWKEVYVPFFNEEFMPTSFREDNNAGIRTRHQSGCPLRSSTSKRCKCASHYARLKAKETGMTAEESHRDEERRLAHVASTRAKDRLVFVSVKSSQPSSFSVRLSRLPPTVFQLE